MIKFYYGIWNNFLQLHWPLRFLLELISISVIIVLLVRLIQRIDKRNKIKRFWVSSIVLCVTELIYLIGRTSNTSVLLDNAVIDWGNKRIQAQQKEHNVLWMLILPLLIFYLGGVFIDLPIAGRIPQYYLHEFEEFKQTCMNYERFLSAGCENYPPLFKKKEIVEVLEEIEESTKEASVPKEVYIMLNERGKGGANIRKNPDLNGEVIGGVREDVVVLFMNEYEYDGERYWLKVFLPEENIEGWLSGKLVKEEQLEAIVD